MSSRRKSSSVSYNIRYINAKFKFSNTIRDHPAVIALEVREGELVKARAGSSKVRITYGSFDVQSELLNRKGFYISMLQQVISSTRLVQKL